MKRCIADSKSVALSWLGLLDGGQYLKSHEASSQILQQAIAGSDWEQKVRTIRDALGTVVERRDRSSVEVTSIEGFPDGEYVVHEFDTEFSGGERVGERVTTKKSADGLRRIVGYYVI